MNTFEEWLRPLRVEGDVLLYRKEQPNSFFAVLRRNRETAVVLYGSLHPLRKEAAIGFGFKFFGKEPYKADATLRQKASPPVVVERNDHVQLCVKVPDGYSGKIAFYLRIGKDKPCYGPVWWR
jgi:hypothetical protein